MNTFVAWGGGITPQFKDNPAFLASATDEIRGLISQMNLGERQDNIIVSEQDGKLSFDCVTSEGDRYSLTLSSSGPNSFSCIRTEDKAPWMAANGQRVVQRNVVEQVVSLDEKTGGITIATNSSMCDNINCDVNKSNISASSQKRMFNKSGIEMENEYRSFPQYSVPMGINTMSPDAMIVTARRGFDISNNSYNYQSILRREGLNIARTVVEDKTKGTFYSACTQLSNQYGYREMETCGGGDNHPEAVVIPPLSEETVSAELGRVGNETVRTGLEELANNGLQSYDSSKDQSFTRRGFQETQQATDVATQEAVSSMQNVVVATQDILQQLK